MKSNPEISEMRINDGIKDHPLDYGHLLSNSPCMRVILGVINQVALSDVTVLINGETGSGKELVAKTIYARSLRKKNPFIKVLCSALPEGLLESELFGFERGAFTGAVHRKLGKFEYANNGTIFLDEIGEIPFSLQAKLNQVLQEGTFTHLGDNTDIKVNVQVIVATNKNLRKAVEEGMFREDLFYRLNVVNITIPPLRERTEEIPFLVDFFLKKYNSRFNKNYPIFPIALMRELMKYEWPGNIRELENLVKQIIILEDEAFVWEKIFSSKSEKTKPVFFSKPSLMNGSQTNTESSLSLEERQMPPRRLKEVSKNAVRDAEKELILLVLQNTRWNRKKAARLLETSYKSLLYKIKEYGLEV